MKARTTLFLFVCILSGANAGAQVLIPDSLFGTNSMAAYSFPTGPELTDILELQNDYVLYGGYNYDINQNDFHIDMVKADYCGMVDAAFGSNGLVHYKFSQRNLAFDFHVQADGNILTCGIQSVSNAGSQQIPYVSRFLATGEADTTFGTMGSNSLQFDPVASGSFFSVKELPDGRIVCMGYSSGNINGGTSGIGAMRFLANGTLDPSFSGDGIVRHDLSVANSLADGFLASNGDVIAAGGYVDGTFATRFLVAVWDSNGVLNPNFANGGIYQDVNFSIANEIHAVQDPGGFITMAASSSVANTINLIRLSGTGIPDPLFGNGGAVTLNNPNVQYCKGLQSLPGNKFLVLGQTNIGFGTGFCMMLNSDGSVDTTFGNQGFMQADLNGNSGTHYARGTVQLPNGQWIFAGNGTVFNARRFSDVSNVPHITQVANYLQTSGIGTYQWYLNGTLIAGATDDTLHFTQNGSYTVQLTADYGCSYLSNPVVVTNVGLVELQASGVEVYPSLVTDYLNISNESGKSGSLSLFSPDGKMVKLVNLTAENTIYEVPVGELASGAYLVVLKTSAGLTTGRILKY